MSVDACKAMVVKMGWLHDIFWVFVEMVVGFCAVVVVSWMRWWLAVVWWWLYMLRGERKNKYLSEVRNKVLSLMCVHTKRGYLLEKVKFFGIVSLKIWGGWFQNLVLHRDSPLFHSLPWPTFPPYLYFTHFPSQSPPPFLPPCVDTTVFSG